MKKKGISKKRSAFDYVNLIILSAFGLIILYPFYNAVISSISTQEEYVLRKFMLFPKNPVLSSYKYIFEAGWVANGYKNTLIIVIIGVIYSMALSAPCAYALSIKYFPGKKVILNLIIFTMFFSGGLIPFYLLIRDLRLINSLAAIILPAGVNTFYMLIMRNFFQNIPDSLIESAKLDGANDILIFIRIILPVSLPILATIILFTSVNYWNEWFRAMLFLNDKNKWPLQLALRDILSSYKFNQSLSGVEMGLVERDIYFDGIKMAAVVVTMAPIMCFYPFVQKFFVKGIMIGALKG